MQCNVMYCIYIYIVEGTNQPRFCETSPLAKELAVFSQQTDTMGIQGHHFTQLSCNLEIDNVIHG